MRRSQEVEQTRARSLIVLLTLLLLAALGPSAGCSKDGSTEETISTTSTTERRVEPVRLGINLGVTGALAEDSAMARQGILTALEEAGNEVVGLPVQVFQVDNESDLVVAVDKTKQLVENDKVEAILGPLSPAPFAAVADYAANYLESPGPPCIALRSQPKDNLAVANGLAVIPAGVYSIFGYYLGKYAIEGAGYKTVNIIDSDDVTSREIFGGFKLAFVTEGGGQIMSEAHVPDDVSDFTEYFTGFKVGDFMLYRIPGRRAATFVRQYRQSGLTAPLMTAVAEDLPEPVLDELGDAALDILAGSHYVPAINTTLNTRFVREYSGRWADKWPDMNSFGGWLAANIFLEAVEATDGDTEPSVLFEAMSNVALDTPAGKYTLSAYGDGILGTGDFFVCKSIRSDGRMIWRPVYVSRQVLFDPRE